MSVLMRTIVFLALAVGLVFVSAAGAEDFEYKEYEVIKGDTLWDITDRELEDPFNWPIVWRENAFIKNPDLIYPGQRIRIPLSLLKRPEIIPEIPEPVVEAPPEPEKPAEPEAVAIEPRTDADVISMEDILRGGYISWDIPNAGEVSGSPGGRIALGEGDEAYIKSAGTVEVGDRFYVVRKTAKVEHPHTGKPVGYLINVLGILEVEKVGKRDVTARIIKGFDGILVGDRLDKYFEVDPVFITGDARKPDLEGVVIASSNMRLVSGMLDVVYIDRGGNDGLMAGDVLSTLTPGTPDRPNGVLWVVSTRDATSTAIVLGSTLDVGIGHDVVGCSMVGDCVY